MSKEVIETTEETVTQLEIIESGSGQIEIVDPGTNSIEISFSGSSLSSDLDISTTTEIITIDSTTEDTTITISETPPQTVEITTENTNIDITERTLISGSFDLTFANLISNPFVTTDTGKVGIPANRGLTTPNFDLQISGTLFSDIISSSNLQLISNGTNDIVTITSQSKTPVMINPAGVITLDNFQYTPDAVEGGLLYSGSSFYLGLE